MTHRRKKTIRIVDVQNCEIFASLIGDALYFKLITIFGLLAIFISTGCVDGPLYGIKKANPYYRNQWKKDREQGPIYADRVDEIRSLRGQIATMSPEESENWTKSVSDVYQYESSPELRREAIMTLSKSTSPLAEKTIVKACTDKVDKVRIAACKALANRQSDDAAKMLATVVQTDSNMSVRVAAVQSLGNYSSAESIAILRKGLDEKSPLMQYESTLALKQMSGQDFDGNVDKWRQFVDSGGLENSSKDIRQSSLPQRLLNSLPLTR